MKSNKIYSLLLAVLLTFSFSLMGVLITPAAGTTQISVSSNSANVGDSVNITVSGSEAGTISLKFNNNVLLLTNAGGATVNGNVITFTGTTANLSFSAIAEGNGDLVVSSDTLTGSSTTIGVVDKEEEQSSSSESTEEETTTEDSAQDGDFTIDGTAYVLSERYTEDEIPAGFEKTAIEFSSGTYNELTNGTITLVYLKPASNTQGSGQFYVYNAEDNSVSPFTMLGSGSNFVIVATAPELFSENLVEAPFTVEDVTYTGYQINGVANDFYFVYGTNANGSTGWYEYDTVEQTIQRANTDIVGVSGATAEEEEDTNTESGMIFSNLTDKVKNLSTTRTIMAFLVFAAVVLIIIIIDILLFRRGNDDDEIFDESEEDFDEDDEAYYNEEVKAPTVSDLTEEDKGSEEEEDSYVSEDFEENEVEVLTLDDVLDEVEDDLASEATNKPKSRGKLFGRKAQDIWDDEDNVKDNSGKLPSLDSKSKLRKQVFKNTSSDSSDSSDGKVDLIDFNDL